MSAKPAKKSANQSGSATPPPPAASSGAGASAGGAAAATLPPGPASWMDSADPRKRLWGKIVLAGVWIYVAALWLLALDQSFHWGIFGPKVPPVP